MDVVKAKKIITNLKDENEDFQEQLKAQKLINKQMFNMMNSIKKEQRSIKDSVDVSKSMIMDETSEKLNI